MEAPCVYRPVTNGIERQKKLGITSVPHGSNVVHDVALDRGGHGCLLLFHKSDVTSGPNLAPTARRHLFG